MSMSVSAVVGPSRLLRSVLYVYAALQLGAACLLLASGAAAPRLTHAIAALCAGAAALVACVALRPGMRRRIDISGPGTIRLTVQQSLGTAAECRQRMQLLPGSTVWTHCLFLLLQPEKGGAIVVLPLLPDSMNKQAFQGLSVAIRYIASRNQLFVEKHKIL